MQYVINPWMDPTAPVDVELAVKQWERLRETLVGLGHTVHVLDPEPGLPDMVFAANGAFVVDGTAYGAQFRYEQRTAEAAAHQAFYQAHGWRYVAPTVTNEGEGDFAYLPEAYGGVILAGYGFRTEVAAHAQAQEVLGRPAISLRLVDPGSTTWTPRWPRSTTGTSPTSPARSRPPPSRCSPSSSPTPCSPTRPTPWPSG